MKIFKRTPITTQGQAGISFPEKELEHVNNCLENQFNETFPISMEKKSFQTYGHIFSDEILLIVTLISTDNSQSPVSLFISKDLPELAENNFKDAKKIIHNMVDMAGIFFDEVLSEQDWDAFTLNWTLESYKSEDYYCKSTRENIELTLEANKLLGPEFDELTDSDF
jgi:hypothetical protein